MAVSGVGGGAPSGVGGSHGNTGGHTKTQSKEDLTKMLQDLLQKLQDGGKSGKSGGAGGGGDKSGGADDKKDKELMELLKKLLQGDIKPEELKKLGKMLGMDPKALEQVKGAGEGAGASEIQGG